MDGKIWDPNSLGIDDFDALDYIDVGRCDQFAGGYSRISSVCKAAEDEYDPADYLPHQSENYADEMLKHIKLRHLLTVENTYLSALLKKLFMEDEAL